MTIGRIVEEGGKDPVLKIFGVAGHSHLGIIYIFIGLIDVFRR